MSSPVAVSPLLLGVFAKWPEPGRAKTRLIPLLGEEGAARAAKRLLLRSLHWIDACPPHVRAVLWADGGTVGDWLDLLGTLERPQRWQLQPQSSGHLGLRMRDAMQWQLDLLGSPACSLIMGTDTPTLGYQHVQSVCKELQTHDAVFVPALDGGYVMMGMGCLCEPAFGALAWGSSQVAEQTRAALDGGGFSHAWLQPEPDLDEPADWQAAVQAGWV